MIPYYYSVRKAIAVDKNGVRKEETDYERKNVQFFQTREKDGISTKFCKI